MSSATPFTQATPSGSIRTQLFDDWLKSGVSWFYHKSDDDDDAQSGVTRISLLAPYPSRHFGEGTGTALGLNARLRQTILGKAKDLQARALNLADFFVPAENADTLLSRIKTLCAPDETTDGDEGWTAGDKTQHEIGDKASFETLSSALNHNQYCFVVKRVNTSEASSVRFGLLCPSLKNGEDVPESITSVFEDFRSEMSQLWNMESDREPTETYKRSTKEEYSRQLAKTLIKDSRFPGDETNKVGHLLFLDENEYNAVEPWMLLSTTVSVDEPGTEV